MAFGFIAEMNSQTINYNESLRFLALGDSYTIGQSVSESERWPVQLGEALRNEGVNVQEVRIIARTGWRTDNLMAAIEDADLTPSYNLVSLLIGVNNQFQGGSISTYEDEFEELLQTAIELAGGDKSKVMVVSIPDYAYTPYGGGSTSISREIDEFNAVNRAITSEYDVAYHNITPISRRGLSETDLVADDDLHPSGKQYTLWVGQIMDDIRFSDDSSTGKKPLASLAGFDGRNLRLDTPVRAHLKIFNIEGKLIFMHNDLAPQQKHVFNLSDLKSGLYVVKIESNNRMIASGKILLGGTH